MRSLFFLLLFAPLWAQEVVPGRYIVELSGEPAAKAAARSARQAEVAREQRAVEQAIMSRGGRVQAAVDTVANALIVEAPGEAALAGLPGVRNVYPVRRFKRLLVDYEREIHQVGQAWAVIGGDSKAGEGMKIAILDTGIQPSHPAFKQPDLPMPEGYPKGTEAATSNKVIVARSYDGFDPRDRAGHGTAVASVAAGSPHDAPGGFFAGVAPKAWLGAYRVENVDGFFYDDNILRALEDAVKDGMDVINMSFGAPGFGVANDLFNRAFDACADNGIIVVRSAGNTPGAMTVDDDASYERVIAVGATQNSRVTVAASVVPSQGAAMPGAAASNSSSAEPLSGAVADIASSEDPEGLGCEALPSGSLNDRIAIIRRGTCLFSVKMFNAQQAGARAVIVYNNPAPADGSSPDDYFIMDLSGGDRPVHIPGIMIGNTNGRRLLELGKTVEDFSVQVRFGLASADPRRLASFSSRGPGVNLNVKPDLVAVGVSVNTARLTASSSTECMPFTDVVCSTSGYGLISGTSFSGPYVAGAAAVVKAARAGLTSDEYRSLIVNSTNSVDIDGSPRVSVQSAGSGSLNLAHALESTLAAAPVSITFGSGGSTIEKTRKLRLKNISSDPATVTLSVDSADEFKPELSPSSLAVGGGETAEVEVSFRASDLPDGAYQGLIIANNSLNGVETRIPYWYGTTTPNVPVSIFTLPWDDTVRVTEDTFALVRIHNASGLPLTEVEPKVTPLTAGATVVSIQRSRSYPNMWRVNVRLGRIGQNSWRVEAGDISSTFTITGR